VAAGCGNRACRALREIDTMMKNVHRYPQN
jgi:hypothetical protein